MVNFGLNSFRLEIQSASCHIPVYNIFELCNYNSGDFFKIIGQNIRQLTIQKILTDSMKPKNILKIPESKTSFISDIPAKHHDTSGLVKKLQESC